MKPKEDIEYALQYWQQVGGKDTYAKATIDCLKWVLNLSMDELPLGKKVFCKNCKYYKYDAFWATRYCTNKAFYIIKHSPIEIHKLYAEAPIINKLNNCSKFEQKLTIKIILNKVIKWIQTIK